MRRLTIRLLLLLRGVIKKLCNTNLCAFFRSIFSSVLKSLMILIITFYLINVTYAVFNKYSFQKFSDTQINEIINAQIDDKAFEVAYVSFDPTKEPSVVVLGSDLGYMDENFSYENLDVANLHVFEIAERNPLERILFEEKMYKKKQTFQLIPEWQKELREKEYKHVKSSLRVIDLFNDGKQEILFCLVYLNEGSGTNLDCSIFDGKYFWSPFPKEMQSVPEENDSTDEYFYDSDYEYLTHATEPIFSNIHSDVVFSFDDENDSLIFLQMIWGDGECHLCSHHYSIYKYQILQNSNYLWSSEPSLLFTGGYVRDTVQAEYGKPGDVIIKESLMH